MPLVTLAYLALAAGLLLGSGGDVLAGVGSALVAGGVGAARREATWGAFAVLMAAGVFTGSATRRADLQCATQMESAGAATVQLREGARPGASARGFAHGHRCRVAVRVRVTTGEAPAGATVRVIGSARREGSRLSFSESHLQLLKEPGLLARWRTRVGEVIDTLYGSQASLAKALLVADETDISPEVRRAFADAGIIHMISVSGLHVAVLAEAIVLVLLIVGVNTRRAELMAVIAVGTFVLFVGAPSPAVRSATMFAALAFSRRLQRPTSPWTLLALGALLPLVQPRVINEIGYHLSVVGMAGLIASGRLTRRLPLDRLPPIVGRLGRETVATIVASAVTAPIVAWHFGRVSLAAPITNLVAAPLFGLAQPALFLSMALAPFGALARLIADGSSVILAGIVAVGRVGAAVPFSALDVQPSAPTALLMAVGVSGLMAACAARHWARPALLAGTALVAALWWPMARPRGSRVELHMIDVGQGDAVALRTPVGRWILVDAGDAWRDTDMGQRIVAPYLRRRGGDIALMILSHPHADHIGGAASVLRRVPTRAILDGGFAHGSSVYEGVLRVARTEGVTWRQGRAGDVIEVDGVRLTVLSPDEGGLAAAGDANEASLVVMAEYRGVRVLLTGDAERDVEARMVERVRGGLQADILKVGHHGSATSSTPELLDALSARVALVSVGAGNRYGHPSPGVLEALRVRGAHVLRTDDAGSIVVSFDGSECLLVSTDEGRWTLRRGTPRRGQGPR